MQQTNTKRQVGRVFFRTKHTDGVEIPYEMDVILLDSHVENVHQLASCWRSSSRLREEDGRSYLWGGSRDNVLSAARRHDDGKPAKFKLTYNNRGGKGFGYSFAGHRFIVPPKEPYEDALIRGHHDFSVEDITEAAYRLQETLKETDCSDLQGLAALSPQALMQRYREDLYILEMCDQIEASIESMLLDHSDPRNFMDFSLFPKEEPKHSLSDTKNLQQMELFSQGNMPEDVQHLIVEPAFWDGEPLIVEVKFVTIEIPQEVQDNLLKEIGKGEEEKAARFLKKHLMEQLEQAPLQHKRAYLHKPQTFSHKECSKNIKDILGFEKLNHMQKEVYESVVAKDDLSLLLRAPTGSGKTEAVLWPCLVEQRRLILALPTRSLLDDHAERIHAILTRAALTNQRTYTMIIDTGTQTRQQLFTPEGPKEGHRRHLYRADVILTTLDKLIYRFFGYQDKTKSMIFPHRIAQSNTILCFDEAHSYEEVAWTNFRKLIRALYQAGQDLLLMTATMPPHLLEEFCDLDILDYCEGEKGAVLLEDIKTYCSQRGEWHPQKKLFWQDVPFVQDETLTSFEQEQAYEATLAMNLVKQTKEALFAQKQRIIVVTNTVDTAIDVYKLLQTHITTSKSSHELLLYHGRLASLRWDEGKRSLSPRAERYKKLKGLDQRQEAYVLVTTHAIEVGCDLDADKLITSLCTPDALIQRAGRCNRKNNTQDASVLVVGSHIPSYLNNMEEPQRHMYLTYLREHTGSQLEANALMPFLDKEEAVEDPRVVEGFDMLYEYVYRGDILYQPLHKRGMLATRSWEPTVTFRFCVGGRRDEVTIPLTRLRLRKDEEPRVDLCVLEKVYDPGQGKYVEQPLTRGNAYAKREIIVEVVDTCMLAGATLDNFDETGCYDEVLGLYELPRLFRIWKQRSSLKMLAMYVSEEGKKIILDFLAPYELEE